MRKTLADIILFLLINLKQYDIVTCQRFDINDEIASTVEVRRQQVYAAGDSCVEKNGGTSLGEAWLECVLSNLQQQVDDNSSPFPLPSYTMKPLTLGYNYQDGMDHGKLLGDLLRNYTCSRVQDGGSPPVEIKEWVYDEKSVMQESLYKRQSCSEVDASDNNGTYRKVSGFLGAGNDLTYNANEVTSVPEAKKWCDENTECEGFTFQNNVPTIFYFKSANAQVKDVNKDNGWTSYARRVLPSHCSSNTDEEDVSPKEEVEEIPEDAYASTSQTYQVKILRHEPLVMVVPNFLSPSDCDALITAGGSEEEMGAAHEAGGPSSYRRSFSSNIYINYDNRTALTTRIAEKHFALVRDFTSYNVHGNLGQEPLNAVLYKNTGDEYRPHCDGPCNGGMYPHGARLATSIVYCRTSEGGSGQTSFTRSGLMVAPQQYDLLLFTYRYNENMTMDNGLSEHSGCPIAGGKKWIATQWYREGVQDDLPWNIVEHVEDED